MKIITGYKAEPHITSQQDRNVNMGIFGTGAYIANLGNKLAATVVSANEITVSDGLLVAEGCTAEVERGTSESMAIANGSQGMLRIDLIVARYTKAAGTGVEDMQLAVITGTPAASNPATPSYNTGSITNGDTLVDFPLYTVNLNGISIESVTRNVDYIEIATASALESARTALQNSINSVNITLTNLINTTKTQLQNSINSLSSTLTTVSNRVGTATLQTTAKNAMAAINELLSRINTTNNNLTNTNSTVSAISTRVSAVESKTDGISGTLITSVPNGEINYRRLNAVATYLVIVSTVADVDTMKGMYLVGTTSNGAIGIKAISNASNIVLSDAGNLLLGIRNNGMAYVRVNIITLYGTAL